MTTTQHIAVIISKDRQEEKPVCKWLKKRQEEPFSGILCDECQEDYIFYVPVETFNLCAVAFKLHAGGSRQGEIIQYKVRPPKSVCVGK